MSAGKGIGGLGRCFGLVVFFATWAVALPAYSSQAGQGGAPGKRDSDRGAAVKTARRCVSDRVARRIPFKYSDQELIGGDGRVRSPALPEGARILGGYSKAGDALVHLVVDACAETFIPALNRTIKGDCETWIYSYCKGEVRLALRSKTFLGASAGRPEAGHFRYIEHRRLDDTTVDYALPIYLKDEQGADHQFLVVNGRKYPSAEEPGTAARSSRSCPSAAPALRTANRQPSKRIELDD